MIIDYYKIFIVLILCLIDTHYLSAVVVQSESYVLNITISVNIFFKQYKHEVRKGHQ